MEEMDERSFQNGEGMELLFCFNKKAKDEKSYEFFCFPCQKLITGLNECSKHCNTRKHKDEIDRYSKKKKHLYNFKGLNSDCELHLSKVIEQQLLTPQFLTKDDLLLREQVCNQFEEVLKKMIAPDLYCRLYGSSLTLVGFKDSNVDIDIKFDIQKVKEFNPLIADLPTFFFFVVEAIHKQTSLYSDVEDNLCMKNPIIKFKHKKSGLSCCILPLYNKCFHTSDLIKKYMDAEVRCAKLALLIRVWGKMCGLDNADSGGLSPYCFVIMVINYLQHTVPPVLPIIKIPDLEFENQVLIDLEEEKSHLISFNKSQHWRSKNTSTITVLFIGFLRYFLLSFHHKAMVINIRQYAPVLRDVRKFGNRRLIIEDPFISNQNVAKSLGSQSVMNFLMDCIEITYKYCTSFNSAKKLEAQKLNSELETKPKNATKDDHLYIDHCQSVLEENTIQKVVNEVLTTLLDTVVNEFSLLDCFQFHAAKFTPKNPFPKFCSSCKSDGHSASNCVVENFIIKPLPPVNKAAMNILDQVCAQVMADCEMTGEEFDSRMKILKKTESHFKENFDDTCRLTLFGSSVNGFGFRNSDLDICLRFQSDTPPKDLNYQRTVGFIANVLKKNPDFHNIVCIKSAKVPIVKFRVRRSDIEGDISLYNCLALANSEMLKTYAIVDKRVRIMGYCIKYFAKLCEIGDASRGSLSSYAYILLMLYYLQHCEPPVVPVLQELGGDKHEPLLVEGRDTWFYSDIKSLPTIWKDYGKNKQSIGELWIGFFNFYLEKFSFNRNVVSVKQTNPLLKFKKSWMRYVIAIEDPFDVDHNLGAGINDNMFKYIISCFSQARLHFGSSLTKVQKRSMKEYYFDPNYLKNEKSVPTDRCCRRCGKIGHVASSCREMSDDDEEQEEHDDHVARSPSKEGNLRCYLCNQRGHRKQDCVVSQNRRERFNSNSKNQKKIESRSHEGISRKQNTDEKATSMTLTTSIAPTTTIAPTTNMALSPTVKKSDENSIYENARATKGHAKNNNYAKDLHATLPVTITNNHQKQAKTNYSENQSPARPPFPQQVSSLGFSHGFLQQMANLSQPTSNLNPGFYLTTPQPPYNFNFNGHQANEKFQFGKHHVLPSDFDISFNDLNIAINNQVPFPNQLHAVGVSDLVLPKTTLVTDSASNLPNKVIPQVLLNYQLHQFPKSQTNNLSPNTIKNGQTLDKKERNILIPKRSSKLTENPNSMRAGVSGLSLEESHRETANSKKPYYYVKKGQQSDNDKNKKSSSNLHVHDGRHDTSGAKEALGSNSDQVLSGFTSSSSNTRRDKSNRGKHLK